MPVSVRTLCGGKNACQLHAGNEIPGDMGKKGGGATDLICMLMTFVGRCVVSFGDEVFSVWFALRRIKQSCKRCRVQERLLVMLMMYVKMESEWAWFGLDLSY